MSRYLGSVCKLCRREGEKLFLKGRRCLGAKCSFERRSYPPGDHGQKPPTRARGEYRRQLRTKQKAKRIYGIFEKPFRNYYFKAARQTGITGENLISLLERRLDNVVYRLGFATSRKQARQLVKHNHFTINGKRVNIPSYLVEVGDVITPREKSRQNATIQEALEFSQQRGAPEWLEIDSDKPEGRVQRTPIVEHIAAELDTQLIIELYSR
jgi:small subunit ribosomal protein S4